MIENTMKKYLLLALIALVAAACSKEEEDKSLEPASADDIITPEKTLGLIGGTINEVKAAFQGFKPSSEYNTDVAYDLKMDDLQFIKSSISLPPISMQTYNERMKGKVAMTQLITREEREAGVYAFYKSRLEAGVGRMRSVYDTMGKFSIAAPITVYRIKSRVEKRLEAAAANGRTAEAAEGQES